MGVTVEAESGNTEIFGTLVSDMQDGLSVSDGKISGTLKYLDEGALVDEFGAGNFMAVKFTNIGENATSVKVGMSPSEGSGLVEIIDDPDKNGVFKVTNKDTQKFKVVATDGIHVNTQTFDLSSLELEEETTD